MFVRKKVEALAQQKQDRVVLMPGRLGYGVPTIQHGTDGIGSTLARVRLYHRTDATTTITGVRKRSLCAWQAARLIPFRRFPLLQGEGVLVGFVAMFVGPVTPHGEE